jgi:hypothetical protein
MTDLRQHYGADVFGQVLQTPRRPGVLLLKVLGHMGLLGGFAEIEVWINSHWLSYEINGRLPI